MDKNIVNNYIEIDGKIKGKYYCFYAKKIEWGKKNGIERIERGFWGV